MQLELAAAGHQVHFVSINASSALDTQFKLVSRCQFPLLQDLEEIGVWGRMNGGKDDMYIYDSEGRLQRYLKSHDEEFSTNLSTDEGYANLLGAVMDVIEAEP